jgi:RNA polymerase sigma factor (TIGR02999 family)
MADRQGDITRLVARIAEAGPEAPQAKEDLARLIYDELKVLAHQNLWRHRRATWHTTALVHEAWIRVIERRGTRLRDKNSRYLFGAFANAMRNILVDHHRRTRPAQVDFDPDHRPGRQAGLVERFILREVDETMDAALRELEREHGFEYEVVAFRLFLDFKQEQIAEVLNVPRSQVQRALAFGTGYVKTKLRGSAS